MISRSVFPGTLVRANRLASAAGYADARADDFVKRTRVGMVIRLTDVVDGLLGREVIVLHSGGLAFIWSIDLDQVPT